MTVDSPDGALVTQRQLESTLWAAANALRGPVDLARGLGHRRGDLSGGAGQRVGLRDELGAGAGRALRLLGNGVHPLAAAHAWRSLAAAHGLGPVDLAADGCGPAPGADGFP